MKLAIKTQEWRNIFFLQIGPTFFVGVNSIVGKFVSAVRNTNRQVEEKGGFMITVNEVDGLIGKQRMGVLMILLFFVSEEDDFMGIFP